MAVVAEMKYNDITITIHDDAYRDVPPEEMERRHKKIAQVARRILEIETQRRAQKANQNEALSSTSESGTETS